MPRRTGTPCQISAGRFVLAQFLPVWLFCVFFCLGNVFGLQTWSNGNLGSDTNYVYESTK